MAGDSQCSSDMSPEKPSSETSGDNVLSETDRVFDTNGLNKDAVEEVGVPKSADCITNDGEVVLDEEVRQKMAQLRFHGPDEITPKELNSDKRPSDSANFVPTQDGKEDSHKVDDEGESFIVPTDEEAEKIVEQVESYFTDFNIMKDSFLSKHIRRNKEGYVSLKLVSSFRRIKALTKDWKVVRYCINRSKVLQLNAEGTKIRRIEPIPPLEQTSCARTVIIFNVPTITPTSGGSEEIDGAKLTEMMSFYGEIENITMVTPGSDIPKNCTKRCLQFYNELAKKPFSLVEFKTYDSAVAAIKAHQEGGDGETKVVPLISNDYKKRVSSGSPRSGSKSSTTESPSSDNSARRSSNGNGKKKAFRRLRVDELRSSESSYSSPDSFGSNRRYTPNFSMGPHVKQKSSRSSSRQAQQSSLMNKIDRPSGDPFMKSVMNHSVGMENSWMTRRHGSENNNCQMSSVNHRVSSNIIRMPLGADGTEGFSEIRISPAGLVENSRDIRVNQELHANN